MALIDQGRLNEQVIAACTLLTQSLLGYLDGFRLEERGHYCEIALENPHVPDRSIEISTEEGEITLSFGACHEHFNGHINDTDEAGLVVEMVAKVVLLAGGAEVSYSAWSGDRCLGGGWLRTGTGAKEGFGHFPQADRLKIVGWAPWNDKELCRSESLPPPDDQQRRP